MEKQAAAAGFNELITYESVRKYCRNVDKYETLIFSKKDSPQNNPQNISQKWVDNKLHKPLIKCQYKESSALHERTRQGVLGNRENNINGINQYISF